MSTLRLHVSGLHEQVTDKELQQRFEAFGKLISAEVIRNAEGRCKGFGYVTFAGDETVLKKCTGALNNAKWRGHVLRISIAKESYTAKLQKEWDLKKQEEEAAKAQQKDEKAKKVFMWKRGKGGRLLPVMHITKRNGKTFLVDPSKLKDNITILDGVVDARSKSVSMLTWNYGEPLKTLLPVPTQRPSQPDDDLAQVLRKEKALSLTVLASMGLGPEEDKPAPALNAFSDSDLELYEAKEPTNHKGANIDDEEIEEAVVEEEEEEEEEEENDNVENGDADMPEEPSAEGINGDKQNDDNDVRDKEKGMANGDNGAEESASAKKAKSYDVKVPSLRALLRPDANFSLLSVLPPVPETVEVAAPVMPAQDRKKKAPAKRKAAEVVPPKPREVEPVYFWKKDPSASASDPKDEFWVNISAGDAKKQWEEERSFFTLDYKKKHKNATKRIARFVQRTVK